MRTIVLAMDGVLDTSLALSVDVLSTANRLSRRRGARPPFEVEVLGTARGSVRTGSGSTLRVDGRLDPRARADLVVVPGLNLPEPAELEERLSRRDTASVVDALARFHERGATIAASCTATFFVARAGLLGHGPATTTWWLAPLFRRLFPGIELEAERTVVRNGRTILAGAALSHADLMLAVLTRHAGPRLAELCVRYLAMETHPRQSRFMLVDYSASERHELSRAERWIRSNLARRFSMAELARASRTSPRTLARRFVEVTGASPLKLVQRLRIEEAVRLLETTSLGFDEIAARVGYAEPAALRKLLKRELGRGARELRARGGLVPPLPPQGRGPRS